MKKTILVLMALLTAMLATLLPLTGCSADDADYTGSYALLRKGECTYLVVHWEYPFDEIRETDFELDLSNIQKYIDENAVMNGEGLIINSLLGNLGFNRAFLHFEPIGIGPEDVETIIRKNIKIGMTVQCTDGNSYKIRLKYNKSIRE